MLMRRPWFRVLTAARRTGRLQRVWVGPPAATATFPSVALFPGATTWPH